MESKIQCAAYYFPNFHPDPRNENVHGKNWTEWEVVKCARPRFAGHRQPKIPAWGYEDESRPEVMAKKIDTAANHGIDAFVFDWYWYDGPFLSRALEEGFLHAENRNRLKFALMWANHDWRNIHPARRGVPSPVNFYWTTSAESVGFVWDYIVEHYFIQPNYWRVNGKPYFSIYAMNRFIRQMGGVAAAGRAVALLRKKAKQAGLPGVHISGIWFDVLDTDPRVSECSQEAWVTEIGLDSYTSYNNVCTTDLWMNVFPRIDYREAAEGYYAICRKALKTLPGPYYPVVTVAWDSSPRTIPSDVYEAGLGYPFLPVMETDPAAFREVIRKTKALLTDRPPEERILFFNAWNEWTEGSYLEPDQWHGDALLKILQDEFRQGKDF